MLLGTHPQSLKPVLPHLASPQLQACYPMGIPVRRVSGPTDDGMVRLGTYLLKKLV